MKTFVTIAALATWAVWTAGAAELEWATDLAKAKAKAKAEKKMVLVDFTGSDWCPPCMKLDKNVFATAEFEAFAKANLVLVQVDFPRKKRLAEGLQKANESLAKQFQVNAFPTVIVLDGEGKELSREEGYSGVGAKEYVAKLQKLKGK
jgi:thioredoxin-related protein